MDVSVVVFVGLGLMLLFGAFVQNVVGFGLAVVAAPFIVMLAPAQMPGALLVTSLALPSWELVRSHRSILWRPLRWAILGRLLTMPAGVWLVAHASATVIAVVVGIMVLIAVALSVHTLDIQARPASALVAGLLTGVSGTAASIGGPFLALVLQRELPARIRSCLAVFFVIGASTALIGLRIGHQLHSEQIKLGLAWIPFVIVGGLLAEPLRTHLDPERMRRAVLALATVAGVVVIVRAMVLG